MAEHGLPPSLPARRRRPARRAPRELNAPRPARGTEPRDAPRGLAFGAILLAAALPWWLLAPAVSTPKPGAAECGTRGQSRPARSRRIVQLLASVPAGKTLLQGRARPPELCFRDAAESAVTHDGLFLLDSRRSDGENAARLGHLLLHAARGVPPLPAGGTPTDCDRFVAATIRAEAEAHALELELRRALAVTASTDRWPFERAFWQAPAAGRVEVIRRHLAAHPEGTPGLVGFASAARRQCQAAISPDRPGEAGVTASRADGGT